MFTRIDKLVHIHVSYRKRSVTIVDTNTYTHTYTTMGTKHEKNKIITIINIRASGSPIA